VALQAVTSSFSESAHAGVARLSLKLNLTTPSSVAYVPRPFEILKQIWVVYFALLVPIFYIGRAFMQYMFSHKLFKTRKVFNIGDIILHESVHSVIKT
jgi:hypothetical protein